jgi:2-polyprenyl-6-methoxyphenol hydroxylase-like FAD-dependent oxidoreductase
VQGHAEIAGAGLAGLGAAVALAQRGWTVRVHERGAELREFGAGVYLWDNALTALSALEAFDQVSAKAHHCVEMQVLDQEMHVLQRTAFGKDKRCFCARRNDVYGALLGVARAYGVEFATSSEVIGATPEGTLELASGAQCEADLVVGADGVGSSVRESLGLTKRRRYFQAGAIRMLVSRTLDERRAAEGRLTRHHLGLNHRRVLYSACAEDAVYLALGTVVDDAAGTRIPVDKEAWMDWFPELSPLIARIGMEGRWDQYQEVRVRTWHRGRVALVGDAAHAMQPHLGQGACLAIVNGLMLGVTLSRSDSVEQGLTAWERRERRLTEHAQRWSTLQGKVVQDEVRFGRRVRPFLVDLLGTRLARKNLTRTAEMTIDLQEPILKKEPTGTE